MGEGRAGARREQVRTEEAAVARQGEACTHHLPLVPEVNQVVPCTERLQGLDAAHDVLLRGCAAVDAAQPAHEADELAHLDMLVVHDERGQMGWRWMVSTGGETREVVVDSGGPNSKQGSTDVLTWQQHVPSPRQCVVAHAVLCLLLSLPPTSPARVHFVSSSLDATAHLCLCPYHLATAGDPRSHKTSVSSYPLHAAAHPCPQLVPSRCQH